MVINLISLPTSCKNILYLLHTDALWCFTRRSLCLVNGITHSFLNIVSGENCKVYQNKKDFYIRNWVIEGNWLVLEMIKLRITTSLPWFLFLQELILLWCAINLIIGWLSPIDRLKVPWGQEFLWHCGYLFWESTHIPICLQLLNCSSLVSNVWF